VAVFWVVLLVSPTALAAAKTAIPAQDFWCLEPDNLARVVNAGKILDLGGPGGDPRSITPNGSEHGIAVSKWRQKNPQDFRSACDGAYQSHFPGAVSRSDVESITQAIEDSGSGPSDQEKEGLALVGGVAAALAGAGTAYGLGNRRRNKDIEYANALLLGNALLLLTSDLEQLAQGAKVGEVTAMDKSLVRRQAAELKTRISVGRSSKSPVSIESALQALGGLDETLEKTPEEDGEKEAQRLRGAKNDVNDKVAAFIADLSR
jgi:hypothetical protein